MLDERRARQMVQYHIEGEHVFPEPECPSCRLDAALKRAGEKANEWPQPEYRQAVEGWAEAVKLLDCWHQEAYEDSDGSSPTPPVMHDGICDDTCDDPCKPCKATTKFCNTTLSDVPRSHPLTSEPLMKGTLEEHNEGKHKAYQFASCTLCNPLLRMP